MDTKLLMSKVFMWMFVGLLVTFGTGFVVSLYPNMLANVLDSWLLIVLLILELGLVLFLSARIFKMKPTTAKFAFLAYSFVSGLTFSSIFVIYQITSIIYIFLITALIFGLFALLGYVTKKDLTKMGSFLLMGLIAVILCGIVNIFLNSEPFNFAVSIITILVFIGLTAYDTQKIKRIEENYPQLPEDNLAIYGALELYLDFINIFLELLNLLGDHKD